MCFPALTTVGQSILQLGERAARMLLERISGEVTGIGRQCILAPVLTLRESTARPRAPLVAVHGNTDLNAALRTGDYET